MEGYYIKAYDKDGNSYDFYKNYNRDYFDSAPEAEKYIKDLRKDQVKRPSFYGIMFCSFTIHKIVDTEVKSGEL